MRGGRRLGEFGADGAGEGSFGAGDAVERAGAAVHDRGAALVAAAVSSGLLVCGSEGECGGAGAGEGGEERLVAVEAGAGAADARSTGGFGERVGPVVDGKGGGRVDVGGGVVVAECAVEQAAGGAVGWPLGAWFGGGGGAAGGGERDDRRDQQRCDEQHGEAVAHALVFGVAQTRCRWIALRLAARQAALRAAHVGGA